MEGDAAVVMMADESDDCRDVVRYWKTLNEGYDAVFGSRFMKGGGVIDYPVIKLAHESPVQPRSGLLFRIRLNDTTNAFKAYRRTAIEGCRRLIAPHFNLTVELPLKTIVRGYSWTVMPITWRNRRTRRRQTEAQGDGQPLLVHLLVCMAGEVLQPRRLPQAAGISRSVRFRNPDRRREFRACLGGDVQRWLERASFRSIRPSA